MQQHLQHAPTSIADGHTHIFNAGFIPVEGVLLARGLDLEAAHAYALFMEMMVQRSDPDAPVRAAGEGERRPLYDMLERELIASRDTEQPGDPDLLAMVALTVPDADMIALRSILQPLQERLERYGHESDAALGAHIRAGGMDQERRLLDRLLRAVGHNAGDVETSRDEADGSPHTEALGIGDFVRWTLLLLCHEKRIARAFRQTWDPPVVIDFRVHHMMDMDLHYRDGRPSAYEFVREQIPRTRSVVFGADPLMFAFIAFDPFRENCQAIIDDALRTGFVGVKFYPPSGYRPIGNIQSEIGEWPNAQLVDERNLTLFRSCAAAQVPVFTHCTSSGMESRKGVTGKFSDPQRWRKVLETAGLESLRICFGHAGGQDGWIQDLTTGGDAAWDRSYAKTVLELCTSYPNTYCDFGYFDFLLRPAQTVIFRRRLEKVLSTATGAFDFGAKCCYGSDWHLISQESGARKYPQRFIDMFDDEHVPILQSRASDIMRNNLLRYLNLRAFLERSGSMLDPTYRARVECLALETHPLRDEL